MAYIESVKLLKGKSIIARPEIKHNELSGDTYWASEGPVTPGSNVVYTRGGGPNAPPCVFLSSGDTMEKVVLEWKVSGIDPMFVGKKRCDIHIFNEDDYFSRWQYKSQFSFSKEVTVTGSTATFRWNYNNDTPFGLFGTYRFVLRDEDDPHKIRQELGTLSLEYYMLPVDELPEIFRVNGSLEVPLMMLRMFVLPQRWVDDFGNPQAWIKLVVDIVHGKRLPLDGRPSQTSNHWLKYDSSHGGPSFTTGYGTKGFNTQAWLDAYRNWKKNGTTTYINCYDQAGITELALCLGIHHTQIHWEYNQLYGFIGSQDPRKAELVGWGPCNNPYFGNDTSQMIINDTNSKRSPFRNHAYLSWSKKPMTQQLYNQYNAEMKQADTHKSYIETASAFEKSNGLELFMIDACGGPHYGTETRQQYEAGLQLIGDLANGDLAKSFSDYVREDSQKQPGEWEEDHHLGGGVSVPNDDPRWRLRNQLSGEKAQQFDTHVKNITSMLVNPNTSYKIPEKDVPQVQDVFRNYIKGIASRWAKYAEVPVRPYTTEDGTTVYEIKICYAEKPNKPLEGQFAMRMAFGTAGAIQKSCASHLAYTALTSLQYLVINRGRIENREYHDIVIPGTFYRRAFVWFNSSIEVFMDADYAWPNNSLMQTLLDKVNGIKQRA